jgi:spermidine synthase
VLLAACHAGLAAVTARGRQRSLAIGATVAAALLAIGALTAPRFAAVALPSTAGDPDAQILAYRESPAGTVVVTEDRRTGVRSMYVDNNAVIGSTYDALKVVRMLGLLPALLHPQPERVLVIGYGAGVTTATIAAVPGVREIEVAEIVPEVIAAASFFEHLNHDVLSDPRVRVVANDGRNHLLLGGPPYDVITCDPVHPLFGSAPLYSLDYFNLCRRRLRPGGVVCQYLPLHRMPTPEFRRAIATFGAAFEETWVLFGLGHAMLAGSDRPLDLDWNRWQLLLGEYGQPEDLAASALATPAQIAALLQLDPVACRRLGLGPPSTDLHPRLEFLAPAAYREGLWEANARLLIDNYQSPLGRIRGLPPSRAEAVRTLVAGKRLLLFSLLERNAGNASGTRHWLSLALQVAGDDPEIQHYARQVSAELQGGGSVK